MKFVHIAAISIWCAGLVCLPGLYVQRVNAEKDALHRLQALVRFIYVGLMSPSAFAAIASGTALIFMRQTFQPWFGYKLLFVGILATLHILTGLVIIRLFNEGQVYPVWRFIAVTVFTLLVVCAVLFLVLAKPELPDFLSKDLFRPGGLGQLIPFPRS
ncbi:hypothetical protein FPY71_08945 [Aureimonas fodinaquatilis]|uniref:Protoporphyrinogen IX oxidase n=1 Tax=Aureimonas fodinaquatilis TaxID=2565783 RepID=A0A5B0DXP4_9HYPH|nr:CopD family protein [Aureimonas fodinaquatilis]KAA0971243.1 hypothetical protein FPY71_08945 [Aureimonas fodinaquatilis]